MSLEYAGISVKTLYEKFGEKLKYSHINVDEDFYDLYNELNLFSCFDGESVRILEDKGDYLVLQSLCDTATDYFFKLSKEEFEVATFK